MDCISIGTAVGQIIVTPVDRIPVGIIQNVFIIDCARLGAHTSDGVVCAMRQVVEITSFTCYTKSIIVAVNEREEIAIAIVPVRSDETVIAGVRVASVSRQRWRD